MLKNKSLIACIILVLLTSGITVYGQETASPSKEKLAAGYFAAGAGMISESGRNSIVYSVGGGGHSLTNRWILGGEGHSSFGPDNAGGYGFFNIGYAVVSTNTIVFYPFLGLGGGAMTREPEPSVSKCALLNPSIGLDYLLYLNSSGGILIGLHAGYTFTLYSNTWNWSMPCARLVLGGFGCGK